MLDWKLNTQCAVAPLSNSSRALKCVGVVTGNVCAARGPDPMVRSRARGRAALPRPRATGPKFCTSVVR